MTIPVTLQRTWGHSDFGVYAKLASDGEMRIGESVGLAAA